MAQQSAPNFKPAFRFEVAPNALKRVDAIGPAYNPKLFRNTFIGVVTLHLVILMINPRLFLSTPLMNLEESWEVNVDFLADLNNKAPDESALPKAEKSPEESVPHNLLPQLPKKFQIEEQQKTEDQNPDAPPEKVDEALAEKEKIAAKEKTEVPKMEDDANKIDINDLRKRAAVEKLKEENKVSERIKAQKDALAKLKDSLSTTKSDANAGSSGDKVSILRSNAYGNILKSSVNRNFQLPENFKYSQSKLTVPVIVVIDAAGGIVSLKLNGSSGNDVYDQAVVAAVRNSAPLPPPPAHLAGQEIQFNFSR